MADISFDVLLFVEADGPSTARPRPVAAVVIGNAFSACVRLDRPAREFRSEIQQRIAVTPRPQEW